MPKIMVKILHIKAAKSAERFVEYIANRSGVDKSLSSQVVVLKATERQKEYINELLKLCPDAKDSYEYEDYIENPTRQNASAFISIVAEYNPQLFADREHICPLAQYMLLLRRRTARHIRISSERRQTKIQK